MHRPPSFRSRRPLREQRLVGLECLEAVTTLLQRIRSVHPTAGLWEAADRQWSWRNQRSTDNLPQLFWFDDHGQPEAAVITSIVDSRSRKTARSKRGWLPRRGTRTTGYRVASTRCSVPTSTLVVHDRRDDVAAYGLLWYDPETATGLVEPMRTEDDHQRPGLARHVLTNGLGLLAEAGVERIKIVYEPGNPAASHLYLSVGFRPHRHTDLFAGRTEAPASPPNPSQKSWTAVSGLL